MDVPFEMFILVDLQLWWKYPYLTLLSVQISPPPLVHAYVLTLGVPHLCVQEDSES